MTLAALMVATPPREKAGARTFARYQFQANVSLATLIEIHKTGCDYRAIFDYHEDLVILNSTSEPSIAKTYQIKAKASGAWKIGDFVTAKPGARPQSIVGKVYNNVRLFGPLVSEAHFLSNAPYQMKLLGPPETDSTPDHIQIRAGELAGPLQSKLDAALDKDFAPPRPVDFRSVVYFSRTSLGAQGFEDQVVGQLSTFLEGDGYVVAVRALHQALLGEIVRKCCDANVHQEEAALWAAKSLSRADINGFLDVATYKARTILDDWSLYEHDLQLAGLGSVDITRRKTACLRYTRARNAGERAVAQFRTACQAAIASHASEFAACSSIGDAATKLGGWLATAGVQQLATDYDAALAVEVHDAIKN